MGTVVSDVVYWYIVLRACGIRYIYMHAYQAWGHLHLKVLK